MFFKQFFMYLCNLCNDACHMGKCIAKKKRINFDNNNNTNCKIKHIVIERNLIAFEMTLIL